MWFMHKHITVTHIELTSPVAKTHHTICIAKAEALAWLLWLELLWSISLTNLLSQNGLYENNALFYLLFSDCNNFAPHHDNMAVGYIHNHVTITAVIWMESQLQNIHIISIMSDEWLVRYILVEGLVTVQTVTLLKNIDLIGGHWSGRVCIDQQPLVISSLNDMEQQTYGSISNLCNVYFISMG